MGLKSVYCCTEIECNRARLQEDVVGLCCPRGHVFPYVPGTEVPIFASTPEDVNEYTQKNAAEIHDNALRWIFATFGTDESTLRKSLISRLHLQKGYKVLVTGAGAGNDLPYLMSSLDGDGTIYAQDISKRMLLAGVDRHKDVGNGSINLYFSVSDAMNLPFPDGVFDAAYHFGGINLFPSIRDGISEMDRVVRTGGRIVIGDEGVAPWLKQTEYGKMLINNNHLYAHDAPLSALPDTATDVKLSWELRDSFYVIEFTVSKSTPPINIDVPHIGKRGGSVRTRYFGQLEGVDPSLRDRIYANAEKLRLSRVAYIESLLESALKGGL